MRKTMFFMAVLGLVGSLWAADPLIGTWKFNPATSKMSPAFLAQVKEVASKESMLVIKDLNADEIGITETGTRTDGSAISQKFTQPKQGGVATSGVPEGFLFVHTIVSPNNRMLTILQNGKQIQLIQWVVSKDGKTLTSTRTTKDAQGKSLSLSAIYDKQ
jgi:hypothetical protein